jgi:hypothetical protein
MKKEYDFSKGERGKFYRRGARLNLPVYLDPDVQTRLTKAAQKRHEEVDSRVKRLLKREIGCSWSVLGLRSRTERSGTVLSLPLIRMMVWRVWEPFSLRYSHLPESDSHFGL